MAPLPSAKQPTVWWALIGLDGRINREVFWLGNIMCALVAAIFLMPDVDPETGAIDLSAISPLVLVALFWTEVALSVKRLHDRGLTGWLAASLAIPFVGIAAFFVIGLMPGNAGSNPFGPASNARGT